MTDKVSLTMIQLINLKPYEWHVEITYIFFLFLRKLNLWKNTLLKFIITRMGIKFSSIVDQDICMSVSHAMKRCYSNDIKDKDLFGRLPKAPEMGPISLVNRQHNGLILAEAWQTLGPEPNLYYYLVSYRRCSPIVRQYDHYQRQYSNIAYIAYQVILFSSTTKSKKTVFDSFQFIFRTATIF